MKPMATIKVCDRCRKPIEYIGWTATIKSVFKKEKTFSIFSIFNGNPDGRSYSKDSYELCADCTKKLENFLMNKEGVGQND